jgi:ABC-type multidrug transport system fused ATPase/permease subunit
MLPGPQVDLTLKKLFVAIIWLDWVLAVSAALTHRHDGRPAPRKTPVGFTVCSILVIAATAMGCVFQLALPAVQSTVPGAQLYEADDWWLHIGMLFLSVTCLWAVRFVPTPVTLGVLITPAISEAFRLAFMVQTKEAVVDPLQTSFDVFRAFAQTGAAVSLFGAARLVMLDIGRVVWRIGSAKWDALIALHRRRTWLRKILPSRETRQQYSALPVNEGSARSSDRSGSDHEGDSAALLTDESTHAPLRDGAAGAAVADALANANGESPVESDEASVAAFALVLDPATSVAANEADVRELWPHARHTAVACADDVDALESEWADDPESAIQAQLSHAPEDVPLPVRLTRAYRAGKRAVSKALYAIGALRSLRADPVVMVLWRRYGRRYLALAVLKISADIFGLLTPVLLRILMDDFTVPDHKFNAQGCYAIASALVILTVLGALLRAHCTLRLQKVAIGARGMLSVAIFRHALSLRRHQVTGATSGGEIATHMTVDVARVTDQIPCFFDLWSLPLQAVLALVLLYEQVSFAFVAGLIITLVLIPVNMKLAKKIGTVNTALLAHNDERVLRVTEVLSNMKAVKMCGWSREFVDWIRAPRAAYTVQLRWIKLLDAWCVFFWATTPILVSLTSFAVFVWMGGELTPGKAIAALSLFATLITPLNAYPWVLNGAVEANVSRRRLSKFLRRFDGVFDPLHPETDGSADRALPAPETTSFGGREMDDVPSPTASRLSGRSPARLDSGGRAPRLVTSAVSVEIIPALPIPEDTNRRPAANKSARRAARRAERVRAKFSLVVDSWLLQRGELVLVLGGPGSGKSTLLHALLGEAAVVPLGTSALAAAATEAESQFDENGTSQTIPPPSSLAIDTSRFTVAFVPQQPFLLGGTVRDNVVFGATNDPNDGTVDEERYTMAIEAARLAADLRDMANGDQTNVGERGSALSGGQRLRVMLARALYADADVYVLDDPLGSLDSGVCREILTYYIRPLLAEGKTVVVSTHRVEYFRAAAVPVARVYRTEAGRTTVEAFDDGAHIATTPPPEPATPLPPEDAPAPPAISDSNNRPQAAACSPEDIDVDGGDITARMQQGSLSWVAVRGYFALVGAPMCVAVLVFLVGMQAMRNISDWYVAYWVAHGDKGHPNDFLKVLLVLAICNAIFALGRSFSFAIAGLKAAMSNHEKLLTRVLYAPVAFFTSTTPGALVNRLSKDVYCIDDSLPFTLNIVLAQFFLSIGAVLMIVFNSGSAWTTAFVMMPGFLLYGVLQRPYRYATRAVKRVESEARSPVIDHLIQMVEGGPVLRAAGRGATDHCLRRGYHALDRLQMLNWNMAAYSAWFSLVLQLIGAAVLLAVAFTAVAYRARTHAAAAATTGLALAYVGPLNGYLSALLGAYTELEKAFVSVERVYDFLSLPSEAENERRYREGRSHKDNGGSEAVAVVVGTAAATAASRRRRRHRGNTASDASPTDESAPRRGGSENPERETEDEDGEEAAALDMADDVAPEDEGAADHNDMDPNAGEVRLEHVSLRYRQGGPLVLDDVSLYIRPRTKVAIVGRTGAGKSSLIAALLRLYPLDAGRVLLGGVDTMDVSHDELRQQVAVLPQDPFVRHGTLRENLMLSRHDFEGYGGDLTAGSSAGDVLVPPSSSSPSAASDTGPTGGDPDRSTATARRRRRRRTALRRAVDSALTGALDDVGLGALPLHFEVGENGDSLSAGQRQLVGIVRLLLSSNPLVVLDEPNAALDAHTSALIDEVVRRLLHDRTVIVVTHKLQTLEDTFDLVVVMRRGKVAEVGPPRELLARSTSLLYQLAHGGANARDPEVAAEHRDDPDAAAAP